MRSSTSAAPLLAIDDTETSSILRSVAAPPARPLRVLVVDDDCELRDAVAELLRFEGIEVVEAENGLDALLYLSCASRPTDVVLLDLSMPVMTGWEFREAQLRDPRLADIPVIVMSSRSREAPPVSGVLPKPCAADDVVAAIRRVAQRAELVAR